MTRRTRSSLARAGKVLADEDVDILAEEASASKASLGGKLKRDRPSTSSSKTPSVASASTGGSASTSASGYSTPMTSAVATPLPTIAVNQTSGSRLEINIPLQPPADSKKVLRKSVYSLNGASKRKWNEVDDSDEELSDSSPDAVLARRLQKAEETDFTGSSSAKQAMYSGTSSTRRSTRSLKQRPVVHDLDSEDDVVTASIKSKFKSKRQATPAKFVADSEDGSAFSSAPDANDSDQADNIAVNGSSDEFDDEVQTTKPRKQAHRLDRRASQPIPKRRKIVPRATLVLDSESESSAPPSEWSDSDEDEGLGDAPSETPRAVTRVRRGRTSTTRVGGHMTREERDRAKLEKNHPYLKTLWADFEAKAVVDPPPASQPTNISRNLKPFQLQGLAWMKAMEQTEWKGGLLGDEMGLGKTIQAVSLVMSDWPAKKPSLVLAPPVALMQWMSEIQSYTEGTLKTIVYHGSNAKTKKMTKAELKGYDVIIMSYNSLQSMYAKQEKGVSKKDGIYKEKSLLHSIDFHRVILDEAHYIKSRTTMTSKACLALKTTYRWCLTGTPLQNRIGEFFSLVRFLKIEPFANYLCRDCDCSALDWCLNDKYQCKKCGHGGLRHVSVFNQELLNPIQTYGRTLKGAEAFRKLRLLTSKIMLRRQKKDHMDSMELPLKEIIIDRQFFGEVEKDLAGSIMHNNQRKFDTYVAQGVVLNNYANIFGLLSQMRQVADHPDLILKKNNEPGVNIMVCCICDDTAEDAIKSQCKHEFCRACASSYVNSTPQPTCPRCHIVLSIDLEQPEIEQDQEMTKKNSIINRIRMENWTSSTKMEMLVHSLQKLRSDNSSHKSIIFSQFTGMLQLIEWRLRRAGITTVMLDGSMTPAQRAASIDHFMNNVDVECFLVSLKAGGVALNLTEASRVFIVDPWWNPAAEWQSADRVHRIGQTRPVVITRLCIEDSIESRIVELQEKKTKMINSTVNSDDVALDSLEPEDLQFLFRGN
ncbi:hypothetical protein MCOR27_010854 [Pyricularia oryzae]|uniref:DNA repair protein RAD16 n=1 Tax=Pyricularia grisea TaxID=148305 RepID=A0ABQ8N9A6_PYRGI|nr:hypothetical protein MCOR01_006024 [Pyricularia oryzae]KAI6293405.1 hypothetical protein MCOR33_009161 [Pyricularia grisea]KAI6259274.1 hypothetical protein MCOR19_004411 [Pyricularia oryzae]KAI6266847.1 hypothetical protein MCOR27_010854 [Pyricularia oryzae]KAI6284361.1 hypothetical protein MCOR26_001994 [Pyricularia oryzae]